MAVEYVDGLNYAKLAEKLRAFAYRDIVGLPFTYDVDSVFAGGKFTGAWAYGVEIPGEAVDASKYWTTAGLRCPSNAQGVAVWTRRTFKYPKAAVVAKIPPPQAGAYYYPICLFNMASSELGGPIEFHSYGTDYDILAAGAWKTGVSHPFVKVQNILPSDYSTAYHNYMVKVNRWGVEFFIDGRLRGVVVATQSDFRYQLNNTLPYAIAVGYAALNSEFCFGLRVGNTSSNPADWGERLLPISPHYVAVGDGEACPPRALHLYVSGSDTRLAGQSISSGSLSSHPIPIFGYPNKTLFFQANQAGTLLIEVLTLTGNWRTYDTNTISANTLWWYKMTGDAVLARLTFTPTTYPCSISEAEVVLNA